MNFKQLKAFNMVMQHGTITAAARHMRVSQPSVTRLIHELETELGFALFMRQGRGIVATVEARRFHLAVESAFISIERLDDLATAIRQDTIGKISVGVIPTFSVSVLPRVLGQMRQNDDKTHTVIYTRNTPAIVDAVQLQQFDLGIVSRSPPYEGVHILYQTVVNYVGLFPTDHPLAQSQDKLDLSTISNDQEFVTFGDVYPLEMQGMDAALSEKLQKNARYSVANLLTAAALVRETGVPAIIDPFSAKMAVNNSGVMIRPLLQKLQYHIAIITRGVDTMTKDTRRLADFLISAFENDPVVQATTKNS
ncbi:LysR family transcriptional regulator [Candidatus Puniceispirillum sp.]|uniref:LysR family transcriptional regulator n=1 Tax=Candidatus Puniceispirillum sp. TaxID=2026719 RepID=UPI001EBF006F|nr:LysR family transcriptional regulator [Candidatus Puniceispirillum sp.]